VEDKSKHRIGVIILAAGASKRMPAIKQLLPWKKTTLLGHVVEQGLASKADAVFVVLGAYEKEILPTIQKPEVQVIFNSKWEQGMGTSVAVAMHYLQQNNLHFDAVLILLTDQPLLDSNYFNTLIDKYLNSNKNIIASQINDRAGVPVILNQRYFKALEKLAQDYGAKRIISENQEDVCLVNSEGKNQDVDTLEAYQNLYEQFGK
jgi:molybdenum cofactor cytidylyltransferase